MMDYSGELFNEVEQRHADEHRCYKQLENIWHWRQNEADYEAALAEYYLHRSKHQESQRRLNQVLYGHSVQQGLGVASVSITSMTNDLIDEYMDPEDAADGEHADLYHNNGSNMNLNSNNSMVKAMAISPLRRSPLQQRVNVPELVFSSTCSMVMMQNREQEEQQVKRFRSLLLRKRSYESSELAAGAATEERLTLNKQRRQF